MENIIKYYQRLIESRKEIQEKYFEVMKNLNDNGLETEIDYSRWEKLRSSEDSEWKLELDELSRLNYEVEEALKLLETGEIEKMIIEEETKLTGDMLKK